MMNVPVIKCSLILERTCSRSQASLVKENLKTVSLSLLRNEFQEIILKIQEKANKERKILVRQDQLTVHRKFVKEGKLTILVNDQGLGLFIANAPPHELVQFVKSFAAKLAGNNLKPGISSRQKLLSNQPSVIQDISPVTLKDVQNLKKVENSRQGLLKIQMDSPVSGRKTAAKRSRLVLNETENDEEKPLSKSPRLGLKRSTSRFELTSEQKSVLEVVKSGRNVFFTGGAGVGKSFLIKKVIGALPPDSTYVTASTGVAAYHIGGMTLHAFAGVGSGQGSFEKCLELAKKRKGNNDCWRKCKHLIIDEISMVDGRFFELLEAIGRAIKGNKRPFGGIQLIVAGDFLQLPPVCKGRGEKRHYCFQTEAWRQTMTVNIQLTIVKRQSDEKFIEILNNLRRGRCGEVEANMLKATAQNNIERDGIVATKLCTHTQDVTKINNEQLGKLPGPIQVFNAIDSDPGLSAILDNQLPVPSKMELKIGAQVMLMKNLNVQNGLVNGARGRVVAFDRTSNRPIVQFACGVLETIANEKWTAKMAGGMMLTRKQLPLKLAWAFSIHKSQGMTLDCVEMTLSKVFECGQAYVALSRAKSLDSVRILDFSPKCIQADPLVLKYYLRLQLS